MSIALPKRTKLMVIGGIAAVGIAVAAYFMFSSAGGGSSGGDTKTNAAEAQLQKMQQAQTPEDQKTSAPPADIPSRAKSRGAVQGK